MAGDRAAGTNLRLVTGSNQVPGKEEYRRVSRDNFVIDTTMNNMNRFVRICSLQIKLLQMFECYNNPGL